MHWKWNRQQSSFWNSWTFVRKNHIGHLCTQQHGTEKRISEPAFYLKISSQMRSQKQTLPKNLHLRLFAKTRRSYKFWGALFSWIFGKSLKWKISDICKIRFSRKDTDILWGRSRDILSQPNACGWDVDIRNGWARRRISITRYKNFIMTYFWSIRNCERKIHRFACGKWSVWVSGDGIEKKC